MKQIEVYARREPTVDPVAQQFGLKRKDTVFYKDAECTQVIARKPWHQQKHPNKNSKTVMLNCFRWKLKFI